MKIPFVSFNHPTYRHPLLPLDRHIAISIHSTFHCTATATPLHSTAGKIPCPDAQTCPDAQICLAPTSDYTQKLHILLEAHSVDTVNTT